MFQLAANEITVAIIFSVVAVVAMALTTLIVSVVFFAVFDGGNDDVRDVQRFIERTDEARSLLPSGHALSDPNGETSAAIGQFLAKKEEEEARRALWESHQSRTDERTPTEPPVRPQANQAPAPRRRQRTSASRRTVGVHRPSQLPASSRRGERPCPPQPKHHRFLQRAEAS
jgi:hypothetical protein